MTLDWFCLYLQIVLLLIIIVRELVRKRNRNLYAILVSATLLLLVQGQAFWVFSQLESGGKSALQILNNVISFDGARQANFYIGLGIICFVVAYFISSRRWKSVAPDPLSAPAFRAGPFSYVVVAIWLGLVSMLLFDRVGGLDLMIEQPGRLIAGQTVYLLGLDLGKMPLLYKLAAKDRIRMLDLLLWMVSFLVTMFNTRFLAAFMVFQILLVVNYCRRETPRWVLGGIGTTAILFLVLFGLYRDSAFRFGTIGPSEWTQYIGYSESPLEWFYRTNVEGFSGVAGALTYEQVTQPFNHNLGLSELNIFLLLIPNAIRANPGLPFSAISQSLMSSYPYTGSVVPSGFERAYGYWGLLGILGYGTLLGVMTRRFHVWATNPGSKQLPVILVSVQLLNGVRGFIFGALVFFGLGDLAMLWLYQTILRFTGRRRAPSAGNSASTQGMSQTTWQKPGL